MDYVGTILEILKAGLSIWSDKESEKYLAMVLELEGKIANEKKKPIFVKGMSPIGDYRDDAVIDDCVRRLATIGKGFASAAGKRVS